MIKKGFTQLNGLLILTLVVLLTNACKKKDVEVISGFSYTVDQNDFRKVTFTNASQNAVSYTWDFGDGSTSTDANPVHTFKGEGSFVVSLAAKGENDSDVSTQTLKISDTNAELTKIAGTSSKTWKLLRVAGNGRYPLEVGPIDKKSIWWAMGLNNDEIANRPCVINDEFTFYRDGNYKVDTKGDFWLEGGVYATPDNACAETTPAKMKGLKGEDLSAWGGGNFKFSLVGGSKPTVTVTGLGAFLGFFKSGTETEVKVPQQSVTYQILKLSDADVDTLIVEADYKFNATDPAPGGYWKFVLVHYDDASKEPPIPLPAPKADFSMTNSGKTYTFTNTSSNATNYEWDFGDGTKATTKDATHTYASDGFYTVKMTASNSNGKAVASKDVILLSGTLTDANLQGGAWKIKLDNKTIFVGPGLGDGSWWSVPKNFLDGSSTGGDDWSCMTNDEFIFSAGGIYEYKANGDVRNDGYMGSPNGCMPEAILSGNAAAFTSAKHTYSFTAASGNNRPIINLTNGAKGAAFIGFYKGYFGGENTDGKNPPNGGATTNKYEVMGYGKIGSKEYLFISVDISKDKNGASAWSVILER